MTRPSIAIFTDNDFEKVNGVTTTLSAVLAHAPADLDVRIYTAAGLGIDEPGYLALASWGVGIPFYPEMRMYWPPYRKMLGRLKADRVGVIHVATPGPIGLAGLAAARHLNLPLIGSFHTDLAEYTVRLSGSAALGAFMRRYMAWLYGHCRQILVPSAATRALVAGMGLRDEAIGVWGRGVDAALFHPSRRSAEWRQRWRASGGRPVLLYVGRVSPEKSVDQLPELHDQLVRLGVDHRLVIVGDGPARIGIARRCSDAVCLGTLGKRDLAEVYASADVFVFPSRTDTAGNVVLEAQASGLPVLVSNVGGPQEQILAGRSGLVCDASLHDWTVKATSLLVNRDERQRMSQAARAFAETRQWGPSLAPLYDAYRGAAGAAASGRGEAAAVRRRYVA